MFSGTAQCIFFKPYHSASQYFEAIYDIIEATMVTRQPIKINSNSRSP